MSVLIVDGNGKITISHFSIYRLNRIQMEHKILSLFHDGLKHNCDEICERLGLPESGVRNHLVRMVKTGSLKKAYRRVGRSTYCFYEVPNGGA